MKLRDFTFGQLGGSILGAFAIILLVGTGYEELTMTQEQREARARTQALRAPSVVAEKTRREYSLCQEVDRCAKYGTARQACAVAGDFKNCVSVKMNGDVNAITLECNEDGTLNSNMTISPPGPLRCWVLKVTHF